MRRLLAPLTWTALCAALVAGPASRVALAQSTDAQGPAQEVAPDEEKAPPAEIVRVPCDEVLAAETHEEDLRQGRPLNLSRMAHQLSTSVVWVEQCLESYGRMPAGVELKGNEGQEHFLDSLESEEPEERAPEDIEEPGPRQLPVRPEPPPKVEPTPKG
jgi:hypothetical protein